MLLNISKSIVYFCMVLFSFSCTKAGTDAKNIPANCGAIRDIANCANIVPENGKNCLSDLENKYCVEDPEGDCRKVPLKDCENEATQAHYQLPSKCIVTDTQCGGR